MELSHRRLRENLACQLEPSAPGLRATTMQTLSLHCEVETMGQTGEARVSERGQMALPAQARHRWGLDDGGTVGWIDLGDAVMLVPGGIAGVRHELLARADGEGARSGFGDPELANQ